jgi:tRNA(Ile)-lysidine synthase TilS/MesJ
MAGIPMRRPLDAGGDVTLVRPVLRVTHAELAVELRRRGLAYAIDPTNADARYRRNFLRERLDGMRTEFPHLDRAVARYAAIVADERDDPQAAHERRRVRFRLRAGGALRDVSFTRVEELRRMLGDEDPSQ